MPRLVQGLILLPLLLLPALPARAADSCPPASALAPKPEECADNLVLAKAGRACVQAYEKEIAAQKENVAKALSGLASAGQGAGLASANKAYDSALAELRALARRGLDLSTRVGAYKSELVWPDDAGSAAATGVRAKDFFDAYPCYAETKKLIAQYSTALALDAKQLALTGAIAAELARKARRGEGSLSTEQLLPLLDPAAKKGQAAPKPTGKQKKGKSDITGTEKNKK